MPKQQPVTSDPRLAEVIAALSLATDLGLGQPLEYAHCVCVLSVRLAEALGLSESELREVYYLALVRHIGCNAETYRMTDLYGDELSLRKDIAVVDSAQTSQVLGLVVRYIREANNGASPLHLARMIAQGLLAVILTGIDIQRVASGKIAENWVNLDALGLLQQLGVVPPPGQASS